MAAKPRDTMRAPSEKVGRRGAAARQCRRWITGYAWLHPWTRAHREHAGSPGNQRGELSGVAARRRAGTGTLNRLVPSWSATTADASPTTCQPWREVQDLQRRGEELAAVELTLGEMPAAGGTGLRTGRARAR
jgi:hypothetical protein